MEGSPIQVSIKDIAASSHVSRRTVSAILFPCEKNKHIGSSEATRDEVLAVSRTLRYRLHRASRNLLVRRPGVIGILTGQFFMIPWPSINGMLMKAKTYDQVLGMVYLQPDDRDLPRFIRNQVVDGLLVYERIPSANEQAIDFHRIPTVYVNTCRHDIDNVINMDEEGAIRTDVLHLLSMARRRPAIILLNGDTVLEQERMLAMQRICRDVGLEEPCFLMLPCWSENRETSRATMDAFLVVHPACDGMVSPHAGIVSMVYASWRQLGRRIPEDMAVICMQDSGLVRDFDPQVTAFNLPAHDLGTQSVELLNQLIQEKPAFQEIVLSYQLHIQSSSGGADSDHLSNTSLSRVELLRQSPSDSPYLDTAVSDEFLHC